MNKVVFSSNSDNWRTPFVLYDFLVNKKGYIDLFPFKSDHNQYNIMYHNQKLFCNPPYSHLNTKEFKDYIDSLFNFGCNIIFLIPSRTDTKIFKYLLKHCTLIHFFEGRLYFNDSNKPAPFPSCLLYCTPQVCVFFNKVTLSYGSIDDYIDLF